MGAPAAADIPEPGDCLHRLGHRKLDAGYGGHVADDSVDDVTPPHRPDAVLVDEERNKYGKRSNNKIDREFFQKSQM